MENNAQYITLSNGKRIFVDGPLSTEISDYLKEKYKKEYLEEVNMVLESYLFQMVDKIKEEATYLELNQNTNLLKDNKVGVLYCVKPIDVCTKELDEISSIIPTLTKQQLASSAIVVQGDDNTNSIQFEAFKSLCLSNNLMVYNSLEEYFSGN